jgi:pilus assembly protein CpaE
MATLIQTQASERTVSKAAGAALRRVGVVDAALGEAQTGALAALFPDVRFETLGAGWPERAAGRTDVLLASIDAAVPADVADCVRRLRAAPAELRVVVLLRRADIAIIRLLLREGAADVLAAPAGEAALAIALDKLLSPRGAAGPRQGGAIAAVIKAGGGVGATALCAQAGIIAADRGASVCLADLDLQFGAASLYLDMPDAPTVSDCLAAGTDLNEISLTGLLKKHHSGLSLLAAPRQVTPLEALGPVQTAALLNALRLSFDTSIVDLPSVWTTWTNRVLQLSDQIVLVTHHTLPHLHMLRRQIETLTAQGLDDHPLTLVCNGLTREQSAALPLKAAQRALGRSYDVIVPEDRALMYAAVNQGVRLSAIQRRTRLERAVGELARVFAPHAVAHDAKARRR